MHVLGLSGPVWIRDTTQETCSVCPPNSVMPGGNHFQRSPQVSELKAPEQGSYRHLGMVI